MSQGIQEETLERSSTAGVEETGYDHYPLSLDQWLSIKGDLSPSEHLAMSGDISGYQNWFKGYYWYLVAREQIFCLTSYNAQDSPQAPQQRIVWSKIMTKNSVLHRYTCPTHT